MVGIKSLHDIYKQKSGAFIDKLLSSKVTIDDDINGSYFSVKKSNDNEFCYYKKNDMITIIDRTISKFYENAINHFENVSYDRRINIPCNLLFVMRYTNRVDEPDQVISKQILRLTHIIDTNTNMPVTSTDALTYWADYLVIGNPPIIFDGKLSDEQKAGILEFVYTNQEELNNRFKSESFTEYIINMLNPSYKSTGIDSVVFRFTDEDNDEKILAKFIDPLFYDMSSGNDKQVNNTSDIVHLIIVQLINYIESYTVKELSMLSDPSLTFEKNYIKVMNKVFVDYVNNNHSDLVDISITTPGYMTTSHFDINLAMIDDKDVLQLVQMNPNFMEIYKILLNFFRKKRRKGSGIFTENMVKLFNSLVDKLDKIIIGKNVFEKYIPTFTEYNSLISEEFNINYEREESIQSKYGSHKKRTPVNIIVDYFQPLTNTHVATSDTLFNKNKLKTLLVVINNNDMSPARPMETSLCEDIIKKHIASTPEGNIMSHVVVNKNTIDSILKAICQSYIPVLWASTKSRISEHALQMEYASKRNTKYNVSKRFKLISAPDPDYTRVMDAVSCGRYNEFCSLTPKAAHSSFHDIKKRANEHDK